MNEYKSLLASRTVWGGIIALAAGIAGIFGYTISPAEQVHIVEAVSGVGATVGGVVAIYWRVKATKSIRK